MLARAAAVRVGHYADQVVADLDHDRPVAVHARQVGTDMLTMIEEVRAIREIDRFMAAARGEVTDACALA
jgi:hypothetical protein